MLYHKNVTSTLNGEGSICVVVATVATEPILGDLSFISLSH